MGTMPPQITSLTIVYSTAYSVADQSASEAENVSIWWRQHVTAWGWLAEGNHIPPYISASYFEVA